MQGVSKNKCNMKTTLITKMVVHFDTNKLPITKKKRNVVKIAQKGTFLFSKLNISAKRIFYNHYN